MGYNEPEVTMLWTADFMVGSHPWPVLTGIRYRKILSETPGD